MNYGILNISTHIAYILFSFTEKSWLKTSSNSITMQTLYQLVWFCFFECVHCNKVCLCFTFTQSLCVFVFLNVSGYTFFLFFSFSVCSEVICCYLENKSKMGPAVHFIFISWCQAHSTCSSVQDCIYALRKAYTCSSPVSQKFPQCCL